MRRSQHFEVWLRTHLEMDDDARRLSAFERMVAATPPGELGANAPWAIEPLPTAERERASAADKVKEKAAALRAAASALRTDPEARADARDKLRKNVSTGGAAALSALKRGAKSVKERASDVRDKAAERMAASSTQSPKGPALRAGVLISPGASTPAHHATHHADGSPFHQAGTPAEPAAHIRWQSSGTVSEDGTYRFGGGLASSHGDAPMRLPPSESPPQHQSESDRLEEVLRMSEVEAKREQAARDAARNARTDDDDDMQLALALSQSLADLGPVPPKPEGGLDADLAGLFTPAPAPAPPAATYASPLFAPRAPVLVKRSSGEETQAVVESYDPLQQFYVVVLPDGKQKRCVESMLRAPPYPPPAPPALGRMDTGARLDDALDAFGLINAPPPPSGGAPTMDVDDFNDFGLAPTSAAPPTADDGRSFLDAPTWMLGEVDLPSPPPVLAPPAGMPMGAIEDLSPVLVPPTPVLAPPLGAAADDLSPVLVPPTPVPVPAPPSLSGSDDLIARSLEGLVFSPPVQPSATTAVPPSAAAPAAKEDPFALLLT